MPWNAMVAQTSLLQSGAVRVPVMSYPSGSRPKVLQSACKAKRVVEHRLYGAALPRRMRFIYQMWVKWFKETAQPLSPGFWIIWDSIDTSPRLRGPGAMVRSIYFAKSPTTVSAPWDLGRFMSGLLPWKTISIVPIEHRIISWTASIKPTLI